MPLLVGVLLAACTEVADVPVDPAVSLGTGALAFEALDEGGSILVIHGPQGGYHLLGSVRTRGFDPGDADDLTAPNNPVVAFRTWWNGDDLTLTGSYRQGLDPRVEAQDEAADAEGWTHEMVGRLCILDIPDDDVLDGESVAFEVEVTDATGAVYRDRRTLTVAKDPRNL